MIYLRTLPSTPLQKLLATVIGLAMLVAGIAFSVVLLPVVVIAGLGGLGYFYWKTRALRRAFRQGMAAQAAEVHDERIIEGEAVVIDERPALGEQRRAD